MNAKPTRPPLGRGPRPKLSAEERAAVGGEMAGVSGFDRPMAGSQTPAAVSEPTPEPPPPAAEQPSPATEQPPELTPAAEKPRSKPKAEPAPELEPVDEPTENLRIPVTRKVWDQLTRTAHERRVTVRYLCLEALSKNGYDIDMSQVPADGRRIKKRSIA